MVSKIKWTWGVSSQARRYFKVQSSNPSKAEVAWLQRPQYSRYYASIVWVSEGKKVCVPTTKDGLLDPNSLSIFRIWISQSSESLLFVSFCVSLGFKFVRAFVYNWRFGELTCFLFGFLENLGNDKKLEVGKSFQWQL